MIFGVYAGFKVIFQWYDSWKEGGCRTYNPIITLCTQHQPDCWVPIAAQGSVCVFLHIGSNLASPQTWPVLKLGQSSNLFSHNIGNPYITTVHSPNLPCDVWIGQTSFLKVKLPTALVIKCYIGNIPISVSCPTIHRRLCDHHLSGTLVPSWLCHIRIHNLCTILYLY